jgi:flagellar hook-basal body complex protein FliE
MALPPIAPVGVGAEFQIPPIEQAGPAKASGGDDFGSMLADTIGKLAQTQAEGAHQAQELATGKAQDVSEVVMAVERASLSLQVAATVRNKAVEAYQEIFRMQV